ncbi:histidine phosphatase family protein [Mesorhizobium sp. NBSH29]|nr:histidine phosphatase family protein [Mesorhizobium sp. NBSH29]
MYRLAVALMALLTISPAYATDAAWALLRDGGHVVLLRAAMAPGTGQPANFDITKCSTQRNLNDRGKQQARKIGALFDVRAAPTDRVLASQHCIAHETAQIAFDDRKVETSNLLDPPPPESEAEARMAWVDAISELIRSHQGTGNLILVAQLETISALTDITPREGEAVIVKAREDGSFGVAGRIIFN